MFVDLILKQDDKKFNNADKNRLLGYSALFLITFVIGGLGALYILTH
ncbi:hypothetical protein [Helicobacter cetorum]|nr:hypothetical protein [Helicobacter cetorum]